MKCDDEYKNSHCVNKACLGFYVAETLFLMKSIARDSQTSEQMLIACVTNWSPHWEASGNHIKLKPLKILFMKADYF